MAYVYVGLIILFLLILVGVAMIADKDDMKKSDE
jgi:hypothetical protein